MKGLEIIKHQPRHEDERGDTFGYVADGFTIKEVMVIRRKRGSISGNHYHTGKDPSRNPEIQYVISGKIGLYVKNIDTNEEETHVLLPNTEVRLHPRVFHRLEMLEDSVFAEFHSIQSDFQDVVKM